MEEGESVWIKAKIEACNNTYIHIAHFTLSCTVPGTHLILVI